MTYLRTLAAELRKTVTLPGAWAGIAVALLGSVGITVLNAVTTRSAIAAGRAQELLVDTSPFEAGFAAVPLGTVGAVVVGVIVIGSEYTANSADAGGGRQLTTTLTAMPQRLVLLAAKAATVVLLVAATALVTIPACVVIARVIISDGAPETVSMDDAVLRSFGAALYWTLTGLIAFAVTVLTRNGIIPLVVFIMNSSLVSISLLLTNLTPLAYWLPDVAGLRLFGGTAIVEGGLDAIPGALVMGAWTLALLTVASVVFSRRDA